MNFKLKISTRKSFICDWKSGHTLWKIGQKWRLWLTLWPISVVTKPLVGKWICNWIGHKLGRYLWPTE